MHMRTWLLFFSMVLASCSRPPPKGADDEVYIADGSFMMGHDKLPERDSCTQFGPHDPCNDFAPRHKVSLDAYFIDKREVSIREYRSCVAEGFCEVPSFYEPELGVRYNDPAFLDFPMLGARYWQALRFCNWKGRRLPTEAEWERAARGTSERDYPWGNTPPNCERVAEACPPATETGWVTTRMRVVGTTTGDATPEGVLDLYGNARELVSDCYADDYYQHSPEKDPLGPPMVGTDNDGPYCVHVVRGAWFDWEPRDWTGGNVAWSRSTHSSGDGLRCARSITQVGSIPRYRGLAWSVLP